MAALASTFGATTAVVATGADTTGFSAAFGAAATTGAAVF